MNIVRPRPRADELEHLQVVQLVPVVNLSTTHTVREGKEQTLMGSREMSENRARHGFLLLDKGESEGYSNSQGRGAGSEVLRNHCKTR